MMYYGGWSFIEAYNLPIQIRSWFMERLAKQLKNEADAIEEAKKKNKSKRR